jgi:2-C-methyl-D-erythritol 4-phosphate cytidylyltransferase
MSNNYYALIPAAGSGSRMGGDVPKQYLPLLGKPLIHHAIARLYGCPYIDRVYVVLAPNDDYWGQYDWQEFAPTLVPLFCGGAERFESVRNGLMTMLGDASDQDWVLVHDAARPCLTPLLLDRLIDEVGDDSVGGLLAVPVADTLKRADIHARVLRTESRNGLWQAQTPQMFRFGLLLEALAGSGGEMPTDEAQAIERLGHHPKLVPSDSRNFKVTYPSDLELAELILRNQGGA